MLEWFWRWETLWYLMVLIYVPCCLGLIAIVLLQKGKGAGFGGAFGMAGGSDTVFGPRASKSLPVRLTYVMAGVFMVFALFMSILSGHLGKGIAPDKVEGMESVNAEANSADAFLSVPGLEDLGSAVTPAQATTEAPKEGAAPAEGAVPADPNIVKTDHSITINVPPAAPAETPAATPAEAPAAAAPAEAVPAAPAAPVEAPAAPAEAPAAAAPAAPVEAPAAPAAQQ